MSKLCFARSLAVIVLLVTVTVGSACRYAVMVVDAGPKSSMAVGTISGQVQMFGNGAPVVGRTVTAINNADGTRHQVTISNIGGFMIKVPSGRYRLEVERQSGEVVSGALTDQQVGASDIDSQLVITVGFS